MNGALIGGILLSAYALYSGYEAKMNSLDWTPLLNAKVWGGGLVGVGTVLYQLKEMVGVLLKNLGNLQTTRPTVLDKVETKVNTLDVKVNPMDKTTVDELARFDISTMENEDIACLNYLMKRAKLVKSEEALKLVKELNNLFFDVHCSEIDNANKPA